jgi:hypothetical protein
MNEDRLALQKAVDSGDTDLGILPRLMEGCICSLVFSVSRLIATIQTPTSRRFLPFNRGRWFQSRTSEPAVASIREGAEPRDAPRLLLLG